MLAKKIATLVAALTTISHLHAGVDRVDVTFSIEHQTTFGESVFLLGDRPELGGDDMRFAVKLEPSQYPTWRTRISLPAGAQYTYRFVERNDAAGAWGNATNGAFISDPIVATAPGTPSTPTPPIVFAYRDATPTLYWRNGTQPFSPIVMTDHGPGRTPTERLYRVEVPNDITLPTDVYITDENGSLRAPVSGFFALTARRSLVQDRAIFGYLPAPSVSPQRKDYNPASPPGIFSTTLSEVRRYRVLLPRGYDDHPDKHYPVMYMHDGQNVFDQGAFGTWNADETADRLTREGRMREVIVVGVDHTDRFRDYIPPNDGQAADDYTSFLTNELMPRINANYRTRTGPMHTATAGSSLGGLVSLYQGFDHPTNFGLVGAFSTASWISPNYEDRLRTAPNPAIKVYIDSGDAGTSNDGFWDTVSIRDGFISKAANPFAIEDDLRHVVGFGQQHNELAWASRLPECYEFLFPIDESLSECLAALDACSCEIDGVAGIDIRDLLEYLNAWFSGDQAAEQDGQPGIGINDLLAFLSCWFNADATCT